jgi:hypothetical protein
VRLGRHFLNFVPCVVGMFKHLAEVAHVKPLSAAGTFRVMVGFGSGYVVGVPAWLGHGSISTFLMSMAPPSGPKAM